MTVVFPASLVRLVLAALLSALPLGVAEAVQLTPHRAVYELSLDGSKAAKRVEAARGEIVYELKGNACSGYSVNLRQVTELETDGGDRVRSALNTVTWEDGAADTYRFRIQNTVNDEPQDDADGVAERKGGVLDVRTTKPEAGNAILGDAVVLPTQHVVKMITAATQGDTVLEARVFDGSPDGRKVYDTLSVIGKATTAQDGVEPALSSLASLARYPVTVSYYEHGAAAETPDYVISFDLYANGVSRALKLDYGDFVLRGTLTAYEALPEEPCSK
ncbi:cell envelope integrity EipB family protein [Ancylobacter lacus]|uniref:cell envelope integrity EipB family protein n=1 Tax=Ancylobacter lacus TaxID=2579970 RepID=UPI001BD18E49|nr:cell envelope integrity EipB family protein [Ancylobacter lacus]MBS7541441.1 cell envelope integrity EipB family protein [Ancylobacter lacus]